jgi:hypothetical protein
MDGYVDEGQFIDNTFACREIYKKIKNKNIIIDEIDKVPEFLDDLFKKSNISENYNFTNSIKKLITLKRTSKIKTGEYLNRFQLTKKYATSNYNGLSSSLALQTAEIALQLK